ncbi:MAG: hypothetical protein DRQ02_08625 [Candidatus Latescibacterota bacterium]|nr:MAG: hypothetical protein DRQ02_08625 [Candidatus Latescibacterota bacterium]RKY71581.1 MAG: hypothetical protein DRQ24_07050 [Candidatus Latescibacterota bacterium]
MPLEKITPEVQNGEIFPSKSLKVEEKPAALMQKSGIVSSSQSDRVELSGQAKELYQIQSLLELAKARLKQLPDIREEKMEMVQRKIDRGDYAERQIYEQIAEKLLGLS